MKNWAICFLTFFVILATLVLVSPPDASVVKSAGQTAAEMKPYAERIPGTEVTFEMLPIPGGTFAMGSPASEAGRQADEGPQHEVKIEPFWMGKFEVTWDEFDQYAFGAHPEPKPAEAPASGPVVATRPTPPYADEAHGYGKGKQPVISITYHAAMEYCRWLSNKTGQTYRLPTEAEWEYASRAGTKTAYSFGNDPKQAGEYGWSTENSDAKPHPVGKKKPNPWGLYDMHGNVAEWCLDKYDAEFYRTFDPKKAALGPVLLPAEKRYPHVVRGGSWDDEASKLRSAARRASESDWSLRDPQDPQSIWWHTEAIMVGFRVVRPLAEQENLKGYRSNITRQSPNQ